MTASCEDEHFMDTSALNYIISPITYTSLFLIET